MRFQSEISGVQLGVIFKSCFEQDDQFTRGNLTVCSMIFVTVDIPDVSGQVANCSTETSFTSRSAIEVCGPPKQCEVKNCTSLKF